MNKTLALLVIGATSFLSTRSLAIDPNAPIWRGQPGTTFQEWTFDTNVTPTAPTSFNNSYGTPSAAVNVDINGTGYRTGDDPVDVATFGAKQGYWDVGTGNITLTLPSTPILNVGEYKEFQLQVVYWKDISAAPVVSFSPAAQQIGPTASSLVLSGPVGGAWHMDLTVWHVSSGANPDTITISGDSHWGSLIDRIAVDVRVVPEPSALLLIVAGAGAGALLMRRRARC